MPLYSTQGRKANYRHGKYYCECRKLQKLTKGQRPYGGILRIGEKRMAHQSFNVRIVYRYT